VPQSVSSDAAMKTAIRFSGDGNPQNNDLTSEIAN
jgi:hypothetical protein